VAYRLGACRLRARRLGRYGLGMHRLGLPCLWRRLLGLDRRRQGFLGVGLVPACQGFAPLVLAQLLLPHQEGGRGAGRTAPLGRLAGTLVASATMAVASAAVAAPAALLIFAFAAFARLAVWTGRALLLLMLVRRLPFRELRRLALLLRLALLRPWRTLLLVRPAAAIAALSTFAALRLPVAALLEARLLLAIAMFFAASITAAIAPAIASAAAAVTPAVAAVTPAVVLLLRPAVAAWLVAPRLALRVLARLRCRRGNGCGRRLGAEEGTENAA